MLQGAQRADDDDDDDDDLYIVCHCVSLGRVWGGGGGYTTVKPSKSRHPQDQTMCCHKRG